MTQDIEADATNTVPDRPWQRNNSTAWLLISILFAPSLWAIDATSMSLFWLAKPFGRSRKRFAADPQAPLLNLDPAALGPTVRPGRIRQWKLALSLAVVAALAAPFASRSYKEHPTYAVWEPLTTKEINELRSLPSKPSSTQTSYTPDDLMSDCLLSEPTGHLICKNELEAGGSYSHRLDLTKYIRVNALVSSVTFASSFLILMLLLGVARAGVILGRRYWLWLHDW